LRHSIISMFSTASLWIFLPADPPPASTTHVIRLKFVAAIHTIEYSLVIQMHTQISTFSKSRFWKV
jgi:transposase